jgi:uncharacterized membrane protein HdeD (DUF308 family)
MRKILKNWKTTIAGIATIVIGIINWKSNPTESITAITGGIGLILANDANDIQ